MKFGSGFGCRESFIGPLGRISPPVAEARKATTALKRVRMIRNPVEQLVAEARKATTALKHDGGASA